MQNEHTIKLYGPIGGYFGTTAADLLAQIPDDAETVYLRIHSPGGSVGDGLAMYNALRDHKARIVAIVDGYAASSASFVMLAGDEIRVHRSSMIFVHNPWTYAEGNSKDLRKVAEDLDKHGEAILDIYQQRTGKTRKELADMMDGETFFLGTEAVEKGFATMVIDDPEEEKAIAAMLKIERMAAKLGEQNTMSKQLTRKEIEANLDQVQADLAAKDAAIADLQSKANEIKAEYDARIEEINAASDAAIAEKSEIIAAKDEIIGTLNAEIETAKADIEAAKAEATAKAEELATAKADLEAAQKALKTAEAKLANPAYRDASSEGGKPLTDTPTAEGSNYIEQYHAITDPQLKTAFWNKHQDEIKNEMKQMASR